MNIFHYLLIGLVFLSFSITTGIFDRKKPSNLFLIIATGLICSLVISIIVLSAYY